MEFSMWQEISKKLNDDVDAASEELQKFKGDRNNMGLLSDEIRDSGEYREAKGKFDRAFSALREFNGSSPKEYMREAARIRRGQR